MSMGGAIAQLVALDHPDRVASLMLIATSPAVPGSDDPDLPAMTEEVSARFRAAVEPDWSDRAAVIDYIVDFERTCSGSRGSFDEASMRDLASRVFDRTVNIESSLTNHLVMDGGERWRKRLGEVGAPTLIVHGTEDPVLPYGHALALAKEIPSAELLALEQTGHELPRAAWDVVVPAILQHTLEATVGSLPRRTFDEDP
jgi:pimeloyl-ACP methyl ester carboxylesterase